MAVMSLFRWYHYNSILINLIIIFNNANKQAMLQPYLNGGFFKIEFRDLNLFLSFSLFFKIFIIFIIFSFFFLIALVTLNKLQY